MGPSAPQMSDPNVDLLQMSEPMVCLNRVLNPDTEFGEAKWINNGRFSRRVIESDSFEQEIFLREGVSLEGGTR